MENLLAGAYDLHIHCWPDVVERKVSDEDMAKIAISRGMKGFMIKSHYTPTAERATMIRKTYPQINAIGSICLNTTVGGINPMAVECAARNNAKFVWFPTMDSVYDLKYMMDNLPKFVDMQVKLIGKGINVKPVSILDDDGKLIPQVYEVLEVARANDMTVATGHMPHEQTFPLVDAANDMGIKKLVITHCDWEHTYYSIEEQRTLVEKGATMEHCFTSPWKNHVSWEEVFAQIRAVGIKKCYMSTDLGQIQNIPPDEGFQQFAEKMLENGFTKEDLKVMMCDVPASLVE